MLYRNRLLKLPLLFLLFINCFFNNDPPPDPDPNIEVTSRADIIGEWVCYHTRQDWRLGSDEFNLDPYNEEDKLIIDTNRVTWRFLLKGQYYEYNFPYYLDTIMSLFCKDSVFQFTYYPEHNWNEPFGVCHYLSDSILDRHSAEIFKNSTDLKFKYSYQYDVLYSYYVRKTWQ